MANAKTAINPTRSQDYPKWYQEVIKEAKLAESAVVRGCMVIKPWGYAIWENIQKVLDDKIKATGHENFYCPLFVPVSYLQKEADHVTGFATECAVVTHHRLEANADGDLVPASPLEEPLVVRPTSEAIIGEMYARWVQSYRDLPILGNQWANVVRWEMRPRMFLRTTEFLWQEGHTAHETAAEAIKETEDCLELYVRTVEDYLAIPVIQGEKTKGERFPGADNTYTIEMMMQDKKALQGGTSHFLGQNFAKAFDIKFQSREGAEEYAWTTSWGITTRLIGGLIMCHSDDDGLVLPPKIAPVHVVLMPLVKKNADSKELLDYCADIKAKLEQVEFNNAKIKVKIDSSDKRPGEKAWGYVKQGVPIRLEIGAKELAESKVFMGRRDMGYKDKVALDKDEFVSNAASILDEIQNNIFNKAKKFLDENITEVSSEAEFYKHFESENAGFVLAPWADEEKSEEKIKQDLKVTPRCVPLDMRDKTGKCIFTGSDGRYTIFARAY